MMEYYDSKHVEEVLKKFQELMKDEFPDEQSKMDFVVTFHSTCEKLSALNGGYYIGLEEKTQNIYYAATKDDFKFFFDFWVEKGKISPMVVLSSPYRKEAYDGVDVDDCLNFLTEAFEEWKTKKSKEAPIEEKKKKPWWKFWQN